MEPNFLSVTVLVSAGGSCRWL